MIFIDFEASSLSDQSWPIEVGVAWLDGANVVSDSKLIRPDPDWDLDDWSSQSQRVHRIAFSELQAAAPAFQVARWFMNLTRDRQLVSDAPEFDRFWLKTLLETFDLAPSVHILDFNRAAAEAFSGAALDSAHERLARLPSHHRARTDAERLAKAFRAGVKVRDLTE